MDKLKMHTPNRADDNFKKLAALFPNAVTETIDENGVVVRAIDKDVLMQEISCTVGTAMRNAISLLGLIKRSLFFLPMPRSIRPCVPAVRKAWTLIPRKTSISRAITSKC